MKKTKLTNIEALQKALDEVQARCTARTIAVRHIENMCNQVEAKLGIAKSHLKGVRFCADWNAQKFPNAYKYTPESTVISAEHNGKEWYITDIYRGRTFNPTVAIKVSLTDEAKEAIIASRESFSVC